MNSRIHAHLGKTLYVPFRVAAMSRAIPLLCSPHRFYVPDGLRLALVASCLGSAVLDITGVERELHMTPVAASERLCSGPAAI